MKRNEATTTLPKDPKLALREAAAKGNLKEVTALIESKQVKVDEIDAPGNPSGKTALHRAAKGGHDAVIEYLISMGANPMAKDTQDKKTAFEMYCEAISYCVPNNFSFLTANINTLEWDPTWHRMGIACVKQLMKQEDYRNKPYAICYGSGDIFIGTIQELTAIHKVAMQRTEELRNKTSNQSGFSKNK